MPRTSTRRLMPWALAILAVLAIGGLVWTGLTPASAEMREVTHTIPKGTYQRRMHGEDVEIFPQKIYLTLGVKDILVLVNNDDVPQLFGPVLMMPGQSFRMPFNQASEYQFACTAHVVGYLTVIVAPQPPWWKLFIERAKAHWHLGAVVA
jgi:hypothetical protein